MKEFNTSGSCNSVKHALQKTSLIPFTHDESYERDKRNRPLVLLTLFLMNFVKTLDKPLVIFFDEADCLSEGTLISFLRQLRDGYNDRSITPFVHSPWWVCAIFATTRRKFAPKAKRCMGR
ncbi:MAG: hypothetical protein LBS79_02305 [Tannerella sp.]|jgi:hypothetical protein|nr:hypothetical protein [Tannerella sp.]